MTSAAESNPENEDEPGRALATANEAGGVDPFLKATAGAAESGASTPYPLRSKLLDYSAYAAMIVGVAGFAWTIGAHVATRAPAAPAAKIDEMAELRRANQALAADVKTLHASLEGLRASIREDKTPAQMRVLQAGLENVRGNLASARSETRDAIAQLSGKVDKVGREPSSRMQQLVDRLGRLEHQTVDIGPTGSIPAATAPAAPKIVAAKDAPVPPAKPEKLASAADPHKSIAPEEPKDQVIAGWVVRDVYDGVALVEGRRGPMEVVPGVTIPGAGVVKSIDRHGNGWTVTTTKGLLAYAAPARDYRRGMPPRDYYRGYRYDF